MLLVKRTFNYKVVNKIFNDDGVFEFIGDDYNLDYFDSTSLLAVDNVYCYICKEAGTVFGVILFMPFRPQVYDAHIACLKNYRGKKFVTTAKMAIKRLFSETDALSIIATCPSYNKPLLHFASRAGMRRIGVMKKCYTKNNEVCDLAIFEIIRS